jgi:hypothetical protein
MAATLKRETRSSPSLKDAVKGTTKRSLGSRVDEIGQLDDRMAELDEKMRKKTEALATERAELAAKRAELLAELEPLATAGLGAETAKTVEGVLFNAEFGKCKMRTETLDKSKLHELVEKAKAGAWLELSNISLADARAYLTPEELALVFKEHHDGARQVKIKRRAVKGR